MGVRHLITFLRPYSTLESLAGQQIVIDGPAFAHHIYFICLKGTRGARNAFEAAPSYSVLVKTALQWLKGLEMENAVIKKIYWDGFLPSAKFDTRIERLIRLTQQLSRFHHEQSTPCRASYPHFENELGDPFDSSVQSNLTSLPPLPFLVPAILEALVQSAEYGAITEVVPGEADLWCAQYLRKHGGLVLTGDSDLLVHGLGPSGAVSFLKDVQHAPKDSSEGLQSYLYRPASIVKRLNLPELHGLRSLAFEIVMDTYITFPKLLRQAQASEAIIKHPKEFAEFLKEYLHVLPSVSDHIQNFADIKSVLNRLDPRISEYVLQSPRFAPRDNAPTLAITGKRAEAHIFLPFLLDCPVHTSAWESSMSVRQLAYSLVNLMADGDDQMESVWEHRKQIDNSNGRELQLTEVVNIADACDTLLLYLLELKKKLPRLGESHIWTAWTIDQDKSSLVTHFMQQFLEIDGSKEPGNFTWDIIRFFAELQASHYSFRILKQMLDVVIAIRGIQNLPSSIQLLYTQLQSLPDLAQFPSLVDASCAVRKSGDQELMVAIKHIIHILLPPTLVTEQQVKDTKKKKKKRKRGSQTAELSDAKKRPTNLFELLSNE